MKPSLECFRATIVKGNSIAHKHLGVTKMHIREKEHFPNVDKELVLLLLLFFNLITRTKTDTLAWLLFLCMAPSIDHLEFKCILWSISHLALVLLQVFTGKMDGLENLSINNLQLGGLHQTSFRWQQVSRDHHPVMGLQGLKVLGNFLRLVLKELVGFGGMVVLTIWRPNKMICKSLTCHSSSKQFLISFFVFLVQSFMFFSIYIYILFFLFLTFVLFLFTKYFSSSILSWISCKFLFLLLLFLL